MPRRRVTALTASSVADLPITALPLDAVTQLTRLKGLPLRWPRGLCVTPNFVCPIKDPTSLDCYLRPVDAVLVFPTGPWLLVSEREADRVLGALWTAVRGAGPVAPTVRFAHFAMLVDPGPAAAERPPLLLPPQAPGRGLQERPRVAALQLFMGHTTYSPERQVMMKRWLDASNLPFVGEAEGRVRCRRGHGREGGREDGGIFCARPSMHVCPVGGVEVGPRAMVSSNCFAYATGRTESLPLGVECHASGGKKSRSAYCFISFVFFLCRARARVTPEKRPRGTNIFFSMSA